MSEEEKRKRLNYRKIRKRIITIQCVIIIIAALVAIFAGVMSVVLDKTYYVNYSEKSTADWGVYLKDNEFYEEDYLGKNYAYIASLIDKVEAEFAYALAVQSQDPVEFEYSYRIDAVVQIRNKVNGKVVFDPVFNEVPEVKLATTSNSVSVKKSVVVDYQKYNDIAEDFVDTYALSGAESTLILKMHVDVLGTSEEFQNDKNNTSYIASVSIPLTTKTVEVKMTSAIPPEEQKILSYTTENIAEDFRTAAILFAVVTAMIAMLLWIYAYLSRNVDITYDIKVARIVRNYKSFIQKLRNVFSIENYQLLVIDSFNEMLEIRDTIQSPILMEENEDRTCTKFYIPTDSRLLYLYEIKVDDYDEIYGSIDDKTNTVEEFSIPLNYEEVETAEEISANVEPQAEPKAAPDEVCYEKVVQTVTPVERRVFTVYSNQKKVLSDLYRFADVTATVVERPATDKLSNVNTTSDKVSEPSVYVKALVPKVQKTRLRVISQNEKQ